VIFIEDLVVLMTYRSGQLRRGGLLHWTRVLGFFGLFFSKL